MPHDALSPRELEVLFLLGKRLTTREIAGRLRRSTNTIAMHRQSILRKLGCTRTRDALRTASILGLLPEERGSLMRDARRS